MKPTLYDFVFVVDVPGENAFAMRWQEETEEAARRQLQASLDRTYLSRDGTIGALLSKTETT